MSLGSNPENFLNAVITMACFDSFLIFFLNFKVIWFGVWDKRQKKTFKFGLVT